MSQNSFLFLVAFGAAFITVALKLMWRGLPPERFLKSLPNRPDIDLKIQEQSLRQSLNICTPVFLGFSLTYFFPGEITFNQVPVIFFVVVGIIFWLWIQRQPAAYIEVVRSYNEFNVLRAIGYLAIYISTLVCFYVLWFLLTSWDHAFAMIGIIMGADAIYQLILICYLLHGVGTGEAPR